MHFQSVLIYLATFLVSVLFAGLGVSIAGKKKTKRLTFQQLGGIVCSIIAISVPCLLAAVRSLDVGTDLSNYVYRNYNIVNQHNSFFRFYAAKVVDVEPLFGLLIYIFGKLGSFTGLLFTIELLIFSPLYIALYKKKDCKYLVTGLLVYFFLFYNFSLSGMRQSIAMSIFLLAYSCREEGRKKRWWFYIIIAFFFHYSTIIFLVFFFSIEWIFKQTRQNRLVILFAFFLMLVIVFVFFPQIMSLATKVVRIISRRYANYLLVYSNGVKEWGNIHTTDMIVKAILIMLFFVLIQTNNFKRKEYEKELILLGVGRYFALFNANFWEALRLAYYFDFLMIIFLPNLLNKVKNNALNKIVIGNTIVALTFVYWIYFVMYIGGYGTSIYAFR